MELSIEELRHIMATMNGAGADIYCPVCSSAREKLEDMIEELADKPVFKEVPEEYKKLGVVSWEIVKGDKSY